MLSSACRFGSISLATGSGNLSGAISRMFRSGVDGAWEDQSDLPTMYQESTGSTAVYQPGQGSVDPPLGFSGDKRLGFTPGPQVVSNPGPFLNTTGWTGDAGATLSVSGGELIVTVPAASAYGGASFAISTVANKTYEITASGRRGTSADSLGLNCGAFSPSVNVVLNATTSNTTKTFRITATAASTAVGFFAAAASTGAGTLIITGLSVKLLDGNHATQATAAARPGLSGRVNLAVKTETPSAAEWNIFSGAAVTENSAVSPLGNMTAATIVFGFADYRYQTYASTVLTGRTFVISQVLSTVTGKATIALRVAGAVTGADSASQLVTLTTTPTRYSVTRTFTSTDTSFLAGLDNRTPFGDGLAGTVIAWGLQITEGSSTALPYQRVVDPNTYDTVGFPLYEKFDGVDDSQSSATGGGGTAGFFWCGAVKVNGGAGTNRAIFGDLNGAAGYLVRVGVANNVELIGGDGTFKTATSGTSPAIGAVCLITAWHDGVNLNVQVDSGGIGTTAMGTAVAGTAGFTRGKDNTGATGFFPGNIYPNIYVRNSCPNAAQRAQNQAYCRRKAGL